MALDAKFTANVNVGAAPFTVTFTPEILSGNALEYLWNFGDGSTSTEINPTHIYEALGKYSVKLTVSNSLTSESIILTRSQYIIVCNVDFDANPVEGYGPLSVKFTDKSSAPSNFEIIGRSWDFGDGTAQVFTQNPVHTFNEAGSYAINLGITLKRI